jgi:thiopurine S-methyltransferase
MSDANPWKARWRDGNIGWHRGEVHADLHTYGDAFFGEESRRVFVPLCGKTHDLKWLADRGHEVIGVELSPVAIETMCDEQSIDASRSTEGPFEVFRAERLTVYCGDFFDLTPEHVGANRVWDRASLIALPPEVRVRYAKHLRALMTEDWVVLLNALDYDQAVMEGPPFSVPADQVRDYYAGCTVEQLHRRDAIDDSPRWREAGHERFVGSTYLIRP